jgi:hypothetical protein
MEPTYTHETKHREKRKKMRELDFILKLGDDTHPL